MKEHYNLIILGGGPAGLTAGLYAARARIDHVLIEKGAPGGQIMQTDWIDNYPGFPDGLSGFDLSEKMLAHAKRFDLNIETAFVSGMDLSNEKEKVLFLDGDRKVTCKTLIICTGARPNMINVPGEKEFQARGVSYCGTCDAPFYRNMKVAVVGGGNTAVEEAVYLTKFASKVYIIHRRDELRATKIVQEHAFANDKIEFVWNSQVSSIEGDDNGVTGVNLKNKNGEESLLKVEGVFVLVGVSPNHEGISDVIESDKWGFLQVDTETRTNIPGVMAAGDICSKRVRQVINAAGEGAVAMLSAEAWLNSIKG
ncbi:thioredoxin-disulfide reductase [Desulforhopalus vacuolatus]|uniref:thioredoxin-disulfide reductase n=1 Tax=Desulforhopalus vacuolatus TaxID=40414 RepID=UPI0019664887|nr:thioredoxin-disulfide reductase [Desulforhopalus vacuolatus]MBM9518404.1 thioredoxin-disulfide reductase [Desulforhopalus vacuolatus]